MKAHHALIMLALLFGVVTGCTDSGDSAEEHESMDEAAMDMEMEEEESGMQYAMDDTLSEDRHGARLMLTYNAEMNVFMGMVENTTDAMLENVRVEVHLSNGMELGPTEAMDLGAGESAEVSLAADTMAFDMWSAHAEVGDEEHDDEDGEDEHEMEGCDEGDGDAYEDEDEEEEKPDAR